MSIKRYFSVSDTESWGLGTVSALVALALVVLLSPLQIFVSTVFAAIVPLAVGTASVLYLFTERYGQQTGFGHGFLSYRAGHLLRLLTLVGISAMILAGTGGRTVTFFGIATAVGVVIFAQIFFVPEDELRPTIVVAEVLAFATVLRWTALLTTPGLMGVDAWVHIPNYAESIRQAGELSAIADNKYFAAPLYHLLVVIAAEAFGTTLRTGLYLTLGLVMPLAVLLMYYSTSYFLPVRWALFAVAAFAIADRAVWWSLHIIPTSMGLVFFLGIFYGISRIQATGRTLWLYGLVFGFSVALIFTHQLSTFIVLVYFAAGVLAQLYFWFTGSEVGGGTHTKPKVNFVALTALTLTLTVINWSFSPSDEGSFLTGMLETGTTALQSIEFLGLESGVTVDTGPVDGLITTTPTYIEVIYALGFSLLIAISFLGVFTLLQRTDLDMISLSWILGLGIMLFVTLVMPLLGWEFLIPSRWFAFVYVLMILLGAHGLRYLELNLSRGQFFTVAVAFMLLFTGPMLVSHKAALEDPVFEDSQLTPAYSQSEISGAETVGALHPDGAAIQADDPFHRLLRDYQLLDAVPLNLTSDGTVSGDYVVYRRHQTESSPVVNYRGETVRATLPPDAVCKPSMDVVYANKDVQYCQSPR